MDTREIKGHFVFADLHESKLSVNFTIFEHEEADEPMVSGSVKWDGCSNWNTEECLHFCCRNQAKDLGDILAACYDWAAELMPEQVDNLGDQK